MCPLLLTVVRRPAPPNLLLGRYADTWMEEVGGDAALDSSILAGMTSAQSEPYGWNAIVVPQLAQSPALLRQVSPGLVEVDIPMYPEYSISYPEVITLVVPPAALTSNQTIVATPPIIISAVPGTARLSGPLLNGTTEGTLSELGGTFNITLKNDSWVPGLAECTIQYFTTQVLCPPPNTPGLPTPSSASSESSATQSPASSESSATQPRADTPFPPHPCDASQGCHPDELAKGRALLAGLRPRSAWFAEEHGWEEVVQAALLAADPPPLRRLDDQTITVTVEPRGGYDIAAPETLTATVPDWLVLTYADIVAHPDATVAASAGLAEVGGSLLCHEGRYQTVFSPPPPPPPPEEVSLLPPPPSAPPPLPPWPPGGVPAGWLPPDCNNTELALKDPSRVHELRVSLVNDSWVPALLASLGRRCHYVAGCASEELFVGLTASSWLHGNLNVSEQQNDALLRGGWNAVVQFALRHSVPLGGAWDYDAWAYGWPTPPDVLRGDTRVEVPLSYAQPGDVLDPMQVMQPLPRTHLTTSPPPPPFPHTYTTLSPPSASRSTRCRSSGWRTSSRWRRSSRAPRRR